MNDTRYRGIPNRYNNLNISPNKRYISPIINQENNKEDDFQRKIDELYKFANINNIETNKVDIPSEKNNKNIQNKTLIYGIKKTILSDYNSLYISSNSNDFKIGINKNIDNDRTIYDCFYLFPNISEINTKNETNIINEKKVEYFENKMESFDIQYFPIDFIACGINIPMKTSTSTYNKLIIKNIYWNIFQTINSENYKDNELLCIVPDKNDYVYKKIQLYLNFELHSQIGNHPKILPYNNHKNKCQTPANTCLYKSIPIEIESLNGCNFYPIEINLLKDINISNALLCLKVSVPNSCSDILKGFDKNSKLYHGFIPFSQFIVSLDYEIL